MPAKPALSSANAQPDAPASDTGRAGVTPEAEATARGEVRAIVEASGTSFLAGMKILPAPRREAMYAVYAFCREVDDIADEPAPDEQKREQLAAWRDEIDALYAGGPRSPIAVALARPVAEYELRREDFLAIIEGMEMDAYEAIQAPPMAELDRYCDRVASAVGRLSVRAFGAREPEADDVANHLGRALQLTNILRDVKEDAERDRLYLPSELLERHGVDGADVAARLADPNLAKVCADLAEVALEHYRAAEAALAKCARKPMRPAVIMKEAYRRILDKMIARGWERWDEPVRVGKLTKIWIALRHGLF